MVPMTSSATFPYQYTYYTWLIHRNLRTQTHTMVTCMLHRVLRAVHTVVTPGRIVAPNTKQEPPETAMSGKDLRQAEREDAMTSLCAPIGRSSAVSSLRRSAVAASRTRPW